MKRIKMTLTAVLSDIWFSQEEIEQLTDEEIMETVLDDVLGVVEEGTWEMERIEVDET